MIDTRDRLTVVETVYYRPYMEEGFAVDTRYSRIIGNGEQPYQRECRTPSAVVTEEWKEVDFGWLNGNVGTLIITNDECSLYAVNPSEEERERDLKKVIEIKFASENDVWFIPPLESFRGSPSDPSKLRIRCQCGEARYTLTVFPK